LGLEENAGTREPDDGPGPDLGGCRGVFALPGALVGARLGVVGREEGTGRSLKRVRVPARLWLQHGIAINGDLLR